LALLVLAFAAPAASAQSDDGTISIMRPEPGTAAPVKKRHIEKRHSKKRRHREQETEAPPEKLQPARRGSSNPVYPAPLPAPQQPQPVPHYQVVAPPPPKLPPPMVVPETGRVLPNLPPAVGSGPGGKETFQDRAARCAHQAGVYGPAAGNPSAYINSCINQ
jgi:hypothetical protein